MRGMFIILRRDLLLMFRRPGEWLLPLGFFIMLAAIFPLALGPEQQQLRAVAPGVIWTAALVSSLLTQETLFRVDAEDGALEQMLLSGNSLVLLVLAKTIAHWLLFGIPLTLMSPLLGAWFSLEADEIWRLMLTLPLGAGVFSLLSVFTAALLAGERKNHFLGALLCLPLCMPAIIFAVAAAKGDTAPLLLLAALFSFSVTVLPLAAAGALRLNMEY